MIKLASITFTCLVVFWLRFALTPGMQDAQTRDIGLSCTALWAILFGAYFGWLLLLVMVRQLGAAIRGK